MEIQYVIINFLILVALLVIVGRKTVKRIFGDRYKRIIESLDRAEEIEKMPMPATEEISAEVFAVDCSAEIAKAEGLVAEKIASIEAFTEREKSEIHRIMIEHVRKELCSVMKEHVTQLFSYEKYLNAVKENDRQIIDEILKKIELTPGDMAYLKHHDVLYVTLTSAYPLPEDIVKDVDRVTSEMLSEVGGKTSLWVLEDSSLIGGLRLRIGDTVYDGTIAEELYQFGSNLNHEPIMNDDTVGHLIQEFTEKAESFVPRIHKYQLGRVMTVSDGICRMDGLADIMYGEVVEFECGERGMVLDIQQSRIGCVIFGKYEHIESGCRVRRVGRIASVPVGECLLGRVVDALGNPIDAMGYLPYKETRPIEYKAPGILDRAPVNSPLHTGIKAIDALVPIGKGQRELIIGDRQTGKTAIAVDTIINQKGKDTVCIYVAIGQKDTLVAEIKEKLEANGAMEYTTIIAVPASASAALQYIAPFSGSAMAEYFMYKGKDVLIVYDDLSKHAVAYRELSLLLHRPSGREAYPGDIFYLHSRLLERAAHLSDELGGGSITALPIIETLAGDISAYIPTNVISITDGQIFLDAELFNEGQRPAVNVGLSVSRVGGAAQTPSMKKVSSSLRTRLAQYRELAEFMQFGSDIDDETKKALASGRLLTEALRQPRYAPVEDNMQAILIFAVSEGYADGISPDEMESFEKELYRYFSNEKRELALKIKEAKKFDDELKNSLKKHSLNLLRGYNYGNSSEPQKKLQTIRSTTKLTRAMKTASTVKYSKLSGMYAEYEKYADEYLRLYETYESEFNSVFNCSNPDAPCCYVVIASNKGMCGAFNTELLSYFSSIYDSGIILSCGKKATEYFERKSVTAEKSFVFDDIPSYEQVKELFEYIRTLMENGKISSVKTVYPQYVNMIKQSPVIKDLFSYNENKKEGEEPVFVPDRETVIKNTAEKIFLSVLYKRVLETALGAQAATLTAMRSAYDTACEYSAKLETEMNRKRQSQVTADVIEISSEFSMKGDI